MAQDVRKLDNEILIGILDKTSGVGSAEQSNFKKAYFHHFEH